MTKITKITERKMTETKMTLDFRRAFVVMIILLIASGVCYFRNIEVFAILFLITSLGVASCICLGALLNLYFKIED